MTAYDSIQHTTICRYCIENRNVLSSVHGVRICDSVVICILMSVRLTKCKFATVAKCPNDILELYSDFN